MTVIKTAVSGDLAIVDVSSHAATEQINDATGDTEPIVVPAVPESMPTPEHQSDCTNGADTSAATEIDRDHAAPATMPDGSATAVSEPVQPTACNSVVADAFLEEKRTFILSCRANKARLVWQIGKTLIEVKTHLTHGGFLPWCMKSVYMSQSTVERYMSVARVFSEIPHNADFEANALYDLASRNAPSKAKTEALSRACAGEFITQDIAREILETYGHVTQTKASKSSTSSNQHREIRGPVEIHELTPKTIIFEPAAPKTSGFNNDEVRTRSLPPANVSEPVDTSRDACSTPPVDLPADDGDDDNSNRTIEECLCDLEDSMKLARSCLKNHMSGLTIDRKQKIESRLQEIQSLVRDMINRVTYALSRDKRQPDATTISR